MRHTWLPAAVINQLFWSSEKANWRYIAITLTIAESAAHPPSRQQAGSNPHPGVGPTTALAFVWIVFEYPNGRTALKRRIIGKH
jgi:hypothetical protein